MPAVIPSAPIPVRLPAPTINAAGNGIRLFRAGGGSGGGGGWSGGSGGSGGGGGWSGWGPWPGNPWWQGPHNDIALLEAVTLTGYSTVNLAIAQNNFNDYLGYLQLYRARQGKLHGTYVDAPSIQTRFNTGGMAFIQGDYDVAAQTVGMLANGAVWLAGVIGTGAVKGFEGLMQLWGQLNSRPVTAEVVPPHTGVSISGTVPPPGNTIGASVTVTAPPGTYTLYNSGCETTSTSSFNGSNFTLTNVKNITFAKQGSGCFGTPTQLYWIVEHTDFRGTNNRNILEQGIGIKDLNASFTLSWDHPSAVPYEPEVTQLPLPDGFVWPEVEPQPETEPEYVPAPLPLPLPSTVPQVEPSTKPRTLPAPSPLVPITPGPVAPPIVRPATPFSPQPQRIPAPTATSNGTVVAPRPVPVPTTPQDAIYPVPGGLPVTGRTMTPTIQAVAQEVGRIEQKLDRMVNPGPGQWGDVPGAGDLLGDAVKALVEATIAISSGTTYTLDSPCEVDEETGEKLPPVSVVAPGGLTYFGTILNRIDAIADLLQVHKNLKQPNCKPKPPTGEFVTVNFEQID